jgi:hypothetical protein
MAPLAPATDDVHVGSHRPAFLARHSPASQTIPLQEGRNCPLCREPCVPEDARNRASGRAYCLNRNMRLPNSEYESRSWRIRDVAPDFRLEDVWALPARGGAKDFATLLEVIASLDLANGESRATRALFRIRYRLGSCFGWDNAAARLSIPGNTETTLSVRLPEDLRNTAAEMDLSSTSFTPLYRTDVESAAELSNRTVHAVMHLAWVDQGGGRYQGQMGVYVKPRGNFGAAYMALIAPFRHRIVYPAGMRQIEHAWNARVAGAS